MSKSIEQIKKALGSQIGEQNGHAAYLVGTIVD